MTAPPPNNYICRERRTGQLLPVLHPWDGIQEDAIRASYQDGVLELISAQAAGRSFPLPQDPDPCEVSPAAVRRSRYAGSA